jgi:hypothetical protein
MSSSEKKALSDLWSQGLLVPWPDSEALEASNAVAEARHLTQHELARRWRMSERTLEAWRWRRRGPPHLRIGGKIIYRLRDVLAYEAAHLRRGDS